MADSIETGDLIALINGTCAPAEARRIREALSGSPASRLALRELQGALVELCLMELAAAAPPCPPTDPVPPGRRPADPPLGAGG